MNQYPWLYIVLSPAFLQKAQGPSTGMKIIDGFLDWGEKQRQDFDWNLKHMQDSNKQTVAKGCLNWGSGVNEDRKSILGMS